MKIIFYFNRFYVLWLDYVTVAGIESYDDIATDTVHVRARHDVRHYRNLMLAYENGLSSFENEMNLTCPYTMTPMTDCDLVVVGGRTDTSPTSFYVRRIRMKRTRFAS